VITVETLDEVLRFHEGIRFVYVLDRDGKLIDYRVKPRTARLAPNKAMEQVFAKAAVTATMADPEIEYHGRPTSFVMNKEKVRIIGFPRANATVLLTTELSFPLGKVEELGQLIDCLDIGVFQSRVRLD